MSNQKNIWNTCKKAGASLLSALLLTIVFVQGFHAHAKIDKHSAEHHYLVALEKCAVCDFNSHQQTAAFSFNETVLPSLFEVKYKQVAFVFEQQLTHRQLLAAADRGPPVAQFS